MDFDTYERTYGKLESAVDAIAETSFENWPNSARALAFAAPVLSTPLGPDVLNIVLSTNPNYRKLVAREGVPQRPRIEVMQDDDIAADVFPKIGPVSWKEVPLYTRLGPPGVELQWKAALGSITDRMSLILAPLAAQGIPTMLHAFPWRNISELAEVRMSVVEGALKGGRWVRYPADIRPTEAMRAVCINVAREAASEFLTRSLEIDLCVGFRDGVVFAKLLEINPYLTN